MRDFKKEIMEIDEQRIALSAKRQKLLKEWIEAEHPLKVGEVVESQCIWGPLGKEMRVEYRWVDAQPEGKVVWSAAGSIIKKNGEDGIRRLNWELLQK